MKNHFITTPIFVENSIRPSPKRVEVVPAYAPAGDPSEITTQVTLDKAVSQMALNVLTWYEMIRKDPKYSKMFSINSMVANGPNWFQTVPMSLK